MSVQSCNSKQIEAWPRKCFFFLTWCVEHFVRERKGIDLGPSRRVKETALGLLVSACIKPGIAMFRKADGML